MASNDSNLVMAKRSLRTIQNELEFLADANYISQQQLTSLLSQLPTQDALSPSFSATSPPVGQLSSLNLNNERQNGNSALSPAPATPFRQQQLQQYHAPPPAYPSAPAPPVTLCYAKSLYAFNPTDAGDLALRPQDRIAVTEYMNAEWWKGRSERTGQEGIFPKSYVELEEKAPPQTAMARTNYGNMPLEVSHNTGPATGSDGKQHGQGAEMGKKFGKKLGNAAVFGAGATIGSKIVNGIF